MRGGFILLYILYDAARSLRENLLTAILSSITVGFSISLLALFVIIFANFNRAAERWADRTHIVVYVEDQGLKKGADVLKKRILEVPGVLGASFISKNDAMAALKRELEGYESLLEGVGPEVLPASFEVRIVQEKINPRSTRIIVERLKAIEWVDEVEYGSEWVEKFASLVGFMKVSATVLGIFIVSAAIFIISNTIRLTVYSRHGEIEIMKYLGASEWFVKSPFLLEGMAQGLAGGVLSLGILFSARYALGFYIPERLDFLISNPFPNVGFFIALLTGAMCMGGMGGALFLGRFLKA